MAQKPDAEEIIAHMSELASSPKLDGARKWWPNWIFRSDHVENTAKILNSGKLLSRHAAESQGLIEKDAASPRHIATLTPDQRRYVRLYFRPQTPTQHANEGIRPRSGYQYGAHMPVPVYLVFSASLLAEKGVRFTRGRLERDTEIGDSAEFLRETEFSDIYHVGSVGTRGGPNRRSHVINARNAEVLVMDELPLDRLRHIVCRSAPERDTLLTLLKPATIDRWIGRIVLEGRRQFFYKRGTFVQEVALTSTSSQFTFYSNIPIDWRGPFELYVRWESDDWSGYHANAEFTVDPDPLEIGLGDPKPSYRVRVTLNGDLAYQGEFDEDLEPDLLS